MFSACVHLKISFIFEVFLILFPWQQYQWSQLTEVYISKPYTDSIMKYDKKREIWHILLNTSNFIFSLDKVSWLIMSDWIVAQKYHEIFNSATQDHQLRSGLQLLLSVLLFFYFLFSLYGRTKTLQWLSSGNTTALVFWFVSVAQP